MAFDILYINKERPNGFPCLDYSDPNTQDFARLDKSVKKRAAR